MKTALIYASTHHQNTQKLVSALAQKFDLILIDATAIREKNLREYDRIGFASGIYFNKFHQSILNFAAVNLPHNKEVFLICTYGAKSDFASLESIIKSKQCKILGEFGCKGYDTFGPFKLIGGLAKGHPDEKDIENVVEFYRNL